MDSEDIFKMQEEAGRRNSFKEKSDFQTLQFAQYNTPVFKERKWKDYIVMGPDNLWPNYLVRLTNICPIHSRIIESKAQQVAGMGLKIEDSEDKDQLAAMTDFLKKVNIRKQLKRWSYDQQVFGYWFVGVTWSRDRSKIANIYHVDASTIRVGHPDEDGIVRHFYYSEDWSRYRKADFAPQKIQKYDPFNRIDENCLLMVRGYKPNTRFYTTPSYEGARDAIELSAELTSYMLNSTKNGLTPSLHISYNNGDPTEEEKETIYRSINALFSGAKNAGRFILSFNQSKDNATTIEPIDVNNLSEMYSQLSEYTEGQILRGHGTSPILCGVSTPGKLGGAGSMNELEVTQEDFFNKIIQPAQNEIEDVLQDLLEINDFNLRVFIQPCKGISASYSDQVLLNTLTVDEIRQKMNLPPLSESDKKNLAINIVKDDSTETIKSEQSSEMPVIPHVMVNDNIKNLSGRQHQNLMRIIRQYSKGIITKDVATTLLKAGLGLNDEEIATMLPDTEDDMSVMISPAVAGYVDPGIEKKKKKEDSK